MFFIQLTVYVALSVIIHEITKLTALDICEYFSVIQVMVRPKELSQSEGEHALDFWREAKQKH